MSGGQGIVTTFRTQSHDFLEVSWPEFDHNRVGVTVNDFRIMGVSVTDTVFSLHFLNDCQIVSHQLIGGPTCFVFSII